MDATSARFHNYNRHQKVDVRVSAILLFIGTGLTLFSLYQAIECDGALWCLSGFICGLIVSAAGTVFLLLAMH